MGEREWLGGLVLHGVERASEVGCSFSSLCVPLSVARSHPSRPASPHPRRAEGVLPQSTVRVTPLGGDPIRYLLSRGDYPGTVPAAGHHRMLFSGQLSFVRCAVTAVSVRVSLFEQEEGTPFAAY